MLFSETIQNWDDWGRVFQSIPAFTPLVREIFRREGLPFAPLQNLTPGTNGVFRCGDLVVKVFFPQQSSLDPEPDFRNEAAVCGHLTKLGVPVPKLLAQGLVRDKYDFYYLITQYIPGQEAGDWLPTASPREKEAFARQLKELLALVNRPAPGLIPPVDLRRRGGENPRLAHVAPGLAEELRARARAVDLAGPVLVHGDLTGENVLVDEKGRPVLIDWADACLAPAWYELPPLALGLFQRDPLLLKLWAGEDREAFVQGVLDGLAVHDFGPDILRETAKEAGLPPFSSLEEVRRLLEQALAGRG